jgi:hypothetical protein
MDGVSVLGALAKLRKATISFIMSIRLSARPSFRTEQLGSHWTNFHVIRYLNIFRKSVEKIQVLLKSDKNKEYST